ncbi:PerC family transcriptional regulator [Citrobacter freundii]|uniref:PerC family transcriptional regulator n=1 Tax=Enterobacteriaceae TaxID=543 RepID=UPI001C9DB63B|nr:PerC family transcriptional regulator [Citrobacter freundii]QZS67632.1 PerC family transcriptional regulator [Raoultella planticola]UVV98926.1 PerC family transcriptional regulator [Citrobacter freundii]
MGQRKCAAAFLLAEEMYQIPATKSVILARDLEERGLYLRAARQWGEVMFEHTQCTEYIVEQRERCDVAP